MSTVSINDLRVSAIIGTLPHERVQRQQIIIDLSFEYDALQAAVSDDLSFSVDYSAVEKSIVELTENSCFQLVEALAYAICKKVSAFDGVTSCRVRISKPAASAYGAMISFVWEMEV